MRAHVILPTILRELDPLHVVSLALLDSVCVQTPDLASSILATLTVLCFPVTSKCNQLIGDGLHVILTAVDVNAENPEFLLGSMRLVSAIALQVCSGYGTHNGWVLLPIPSSCPSSSLLFVPSLPPGLHVVDLLFPPPPSLDCA